jgi:hypothetical protein
MNATSPNTGDLADLEAYILWCVKCNAAAERQYEEERAEAEGLK